MTNEQIRIAIAESVGWKEKSVVGNGVVIDLEGPEGQMGKDKIPDLPNDLNAMHEVENEIERQGLWISYCKELEKLVKNPITAPAQQRAEAYLRTKGLWKE